MPLLAHPDGYPQHNRRSTRPRLVAGIVGVALALASCNGELAEPTVRDVRPNFDHEGTFEYDLVNDADGEIIINGGLWRQSDDFQVGTGNLNPFLGIQSGVNDYDSNADTEEGFHSDVSPNDLEGDGKRPNFTSSLPLNFVPIIKVGSDFYREFIFDANEPSDGNSHLFSIDRFDMYLCDDDDADIYDEFTDFRDNADCVIVYELDDPADDDADDTHLALASAALSSGSGKNFDYQILVPQSAFEAAGFDLSGCTYNPTADPCGIFIVLDTKMGGKGGDYVVGSGFEEYSTVERGYVEVNKTAVTSLTRSYTWDIDKVATGDGADGELILAPGQVYSQEYQVTVSLDDSTDSDWHVEGTITIHNPSEDDVTIDDVTDAISGVGAATVDCPVTLPYLLEAGESLVCTYESDLPDGADRTNTASVTLADLATTQATADVDFPPLAANITRVDECIVVKDEGDLGDTDPLGTVCIPDLPSPPAGSFEAPKTFTYSWQVPTGAAQCGENTYDNLATGTTIDTDTEITDPASIVVTIECEEGCTLTPGYWKTHNDSFQPAGGGPPTDDTWDLITPFAELSGFFTTANSYPVPGPNNIAAPFTWFSVFWTSPAGNAYYNLSFQYMAAVLNTLNGVTPPAGVVTALASAQDLFDSYTPAQIGVLHGNNPLRQQIIQLAGTLGAFNEGTTGPGHCDEDSASLLSR
jgi:hypothetical protein